MKRICYESLISLGSKEVYLPVVNRYTDDVIERAGFRFVPDEDETQNSIGAKRTIVGSISNLMHDFIFSSRDGSERSVNSMAAGNLIQLLQVVSQSQLLPAIPKEKMFEIINEIFRLMGATDLKLAVPPGQEGQTAGEPDETQKMLSTLAQAIQENSSAIQAMGGGQPQQPTQPQPQPPIGPPAV